MRGMGAQAVLLGIVLCVEDDSTSESREPVKLENINTSTYRLTLLDVIV